MQAYHFVGSKLRDGSPIPPDGEWLTHTGDLKLCESGFHASRDPFDALAYAPGSTLCLVELRGEFIESNDKIVARQRRIIKRIDAEPLLRTFAKQCALSVIHLWDAPQVVIDFLNGDDTKRDAAWDAARAAAWAAARDAWAAAWDAAWAAAKAAAWDAARAAAWAAAWDARAAAWDAARERFNRLVVESFNLTT